MCIYQNASGQRVMPLRGLSTVHQRVSFLPDRLQVPDVGPLDAVAHSPRVPNARLVVVLPKALPVAGLAQNHTNARAI